ncbi:hypothetical protein K439DRAFT_1635055 [Ramaria rubella]|nr:hypothetical protein K439DRAFT_1635055 [Ramaria rubella]
MNHTSSPTSCTIQHFDTVELSICEEAHAEQDEYILEMLRIPNVPDELDPWVPQLLSLIVVTARVAGHRMALIDPSEGRKLLQTNKPLMRELQDASGVCSTPHPTPVKEVHDLLADLTLTDIG